MPEKDGDEGKSTKSVVNKRQKQMMGEEGYDIARDMGRVRPSKDKKDATTMPVSKEMKKTQKVNKGPSALELVKKKYKGQIMNVGKKKVKEELDLTQVAEAFGGYIIEAKRGRKPKDYLSGRISLTGNIPKSQRISSDDAEAQAKADAETAKRLADAEKSGKIDDFTSQTIAGAPDTTKLQRDADTGKTIANPVTTSKQTDEKTARASTAGTGGKKVKDEGKFSKETDLEDAIKGKTKTPVTTPPKVTKPKVTKPKVTGAKVTIGNQIQGPLPSPKEKSPKVTTGKEPEKKKFKSFMKSPEFYKKDREKVIQKRKEYGIDPEGKTATDAGIERYATKTKQLASGSNVPVEITQADKDLAKKRMLGDPEDPTTGTGKYGGRMSKQMTPKALQKLRTKLKTQGFIGDKEPEKVSYNTKDRVTVNTSDTDKVATPKPKPSKLSMVGTALKKNPVTPLIAYDLGKGILSKIMNLRGPGIKGGRAGFRSAGGNVAT